MTTKLGILRFPLLASAFGMLLAALWAGLLRLGWAMPHADVDLATAHGPLMVAGFLGTLISIERAVAVAFYLKSPLVRQLPYLAPLFSAMGAFSLILGFDPSPAPLLITLSSVVLVYVFTYIIFKQPVFYTVLMGLGAFSWMIGNVRWYAGVPLHEIVPWWIGFLVLTIVAERLELARISRITANWRTFFNIFMGSFLFGMVITWQNPDIGNRIMGIGQVGIAIWLLQHDIARRTIRKSGLTRYIAACLLMGYMWLGVSGGLAIVYGDAVAGYYYDAMLHSIFLGFAFSMIFAHAPIILPSILGVSLNYHPVFYVHFALLQLSLGLRIFGDISLWLDGRRWGGLMNVAVILLFMGTSAGSVLRGRLTVTTTRSEQPRHVAFPVGVSIFGVGLIIIALFGMSNRSPSSKAPPENTFNAVQPQETYDNSTISAGKQLFESYCGACHGMDAQGLPGLGVNLLESVYVETHNDENLLAFVIRGRQPWDADNTTGVAMPPRAGNPTLSDEDILTIIAYLRSQRQ